MSAIARRTASDRPRSAKTGRGGSATGEGEAASGSSIKAESCSVESAGAVAMSFKVGPVNWLAAADAGAGRPAATRRTCANAAYQEHARESQGFVPDWGGVGAGGGI